MVVRGDVADSEKVERLATDTEARFGPIDVWINNAMVTVLSPVAEMKPEEFRRVMEVNYLGTVHGTLAALSRMRPRKKAVRPSRLIAKVCRRTSSSRISRSPRRKQK